MISSKYTIREQNRSLLLHTIINNQEISRAELAQQTAMNKASVSEITKELLDNQLITETRIGNASHFGGRKPILLTFNQSAGYVIAIDLGPHYIEALLANLAGVKIAFFQKKDVQITSQNVTTYITDILTLFNHKLPSSPHGIVGITIAVHGVIKQDTILFTPNYDLDNCSLKSYFETHVPFPVYIQNEANLAALGEYSFGSLSENLVAISIHSGVGAGIVRRGAVYTGENGKSGEIGHMTIVANGLPCSCGNLGCLELYASHEALYQTLYQTFNLNYINSDKVALLYQELPDKVEPILKHYAKLISIGIHNTVLMSDPDCVIINSSVFQKIPELLHWTTQNIHSRFSKDIVIQTSHLHGNAILYGGVALATQNFLNIQGLKFISSGNTN